MAKVEKRLDSTVKLIQAGMKMLVKMQQENREFKKETRQALHALIEAQMRTDAQIQTMSSDLKTVGTKVDRLVDSWGKNRGNGHRR